MTTSGGDVWAKVMLSWRKQGWEKGQQEAKGQGQRPHQLGSIPSGELKGEPETRSKACQADGKTQWELETASGSVLTLGGPITHGISGEPKHRRP